MNDEQKWKAVGLIPTLPVPDLAAAVAHYETLGFSVRWRYPESDGDATPDLVTTHVGLGFGDLTFMLAATPQDARIHRQHVYVIMRDVRAYHEYVRQRVTQDVPELVDSDYGMVDFALVDPWGHLVTFGQES